MRLQAMVQWKRWLASTFGERAIQPSTWMRVPGAMIGWSSRTVSPASEDRHFGGMPGCRVGWMCERYLHRTGEAGTEAEREQISRSRGLH